MDQLKVSKETFEAIAREILSDDSRVGIDGKKPPIIIHENPLRLEQRLQEIEQKLDAQQK